MTWFLNNKLSGPDGLEAWVVAFSACIINFVMAGLGRMSGIMFVAFIETFQIDRRTASLPFSLRASMRNLLGPIVGIFGQKYGARPVVITGAVFGSMSTALCFYTNDILWVTVLWGGISGFGAALTTTLNQGIVAEHFKKHRTTATGLAFSGGCVGSFIFPVLLEYLIYTFGLKGTFLIISGILMHVIPASLLLKRPSWINVPSLTVQVATISGDVQNILNPKETKDEVKGNDFRVRKQSLDSTSNKAVPLMNLTLPNSRNASISKKEIDKDILWENRKDIIHLLTYGFSLKNPTSNIFQNNIFTENMSIREIGDFFNKMFSEISHEDVRPAGIYSGSGKCSLKTSALMNNFVNAYLSEPSNVSVCNTIRLLSFSLTNLFERKLENILETFSEKDFENLSKALDELKNVHKLVNIQIELCRTLNSPNKICSLENGGGDSKSQRNIKSNTKRSNSLFSHIKTAFKLYLKPIFVLICCCRCVHFMTFMPILTTIVDFSMDKGLSEGDGKYVIAALSVGDLLGRLCLGWVTDHGYVTLQRYMMFGMIIKAGCTCSLTFMDSRATLFSVVAVFGLLQGSIFVRQTVLINHYLESHEQSIALGCVNLFSGLLAFVLPSFIGYFRDTIGSYNGMLYINGAIEAFIGLLWLFEPYFLKFSRTREKMTLEI